MENEGKAGGVNGAARAQQTNGSEVIGQFAAVVAMVLIAVIKLVLM